MIQSTILSALLNIMPSIPVIDSMPSVNCQNVLYASEQLVCDTVSGLKTQPRYGYL